MSSGSLLIMIFSPEFRYRSSFPSLIFLIISAGLLKNIHYPESELFVRARINKFRLVQWIGTAYVCMTILTSLYLYTLQHQQTETVLSVIKKEQSEPQKKTLIVKERPYALKDYSFYNAITGAHLIFPYSITSDEKSWINKDVSLYYGITAIRTEKEEDLKQ